MKQLKLTKQILKEIIKEELLAETRSLGPWRAAFGKVPTGEPLTDVERELTQLAAGLKRRGLTDADLDELLAPLAAAVKANVEGELGLEETKTKLTKQRLKEIVREEFSMMTERVATVPQANLMEGERADRLWASNPSNPLYSPVDSREVEPPQLYTVNIELGEFSAPDLDAAIQTAKNWLEMGLELQDGTSPEVLDALGAEEEL